MLDWVRRIRLETGKRPLVIVDGAVAFLLPGEDENAAKDIRALFNRCRAADRDAQDQPRLGVQGI